MHKVSEQTVQAAQEHALISLEHGKSIEEVGLRMQSDQTEQEGQRIKAYGETVQKHAQKSLEKAQKLTEDNSTDVFVESVQEHIKASVAHVEAVREFEKASHAYLDLVKKNIDLNDPDGN